jgi:hypothetical protein
MFHRITAGSHLGDTGYIFSNLGGLYRVFRITEEGTGDQRATFTRFDDMWEWAKENPLPAV